MRGVKLAVVVCAALALAQASAVKDRATEQRLGGPDRFLTSVSTDKPVYKVGETVYVRGVVLHATKHTPGPGFTPLVEIKGPKGEVLTTGQTAVTDGALGFSWTVPEGSAGGEYSVSVRYPGNQEAPATRKFDVRVYRAPRIKTQIVFAREGYGPGDTVTATLEATRAEGGFPEKAKVTAVARVDGVDVATVPAAIDAKGKATVSFALPKHIERGEGTLSFTIEDGGVVETAAKTMPILMQQIDVAVYPEGGDLVAGLVNRVYVEAKTPAQKPADLRAAVVDAKGSVVAEFSTEHEGRGRVTFTPVKGQTYSLRVLAPAGITKPVPLPAVKVDGAVVQAQADLTPFDQPVKVRVGFTGDRVVKVTLSQREKQLDAVTVDASKQAGADVALKAGDADGVLVVTVWNKDQTLPLAERLVFRQPKRQLKVELKAERDRYTPGGEVKLRVKTTVDGKPVAGVVGLTVTDDAVLQMIEKREQAPSLAAMVWFENDVKTLNDPQVYVDAANPKGPRAVDLLLATQGWRRFAFVDVGAFMTRAGDFARRALAFAIAPPPPEIVATGLGGIGQGGGGRGLGMFGSGMGAMRRGGGPVPPGAPMPPAAVPAAAMPKGEGAPVDALAAAAPVELQKAAVAPPPPPRSAPAPPAQAAVAKNEIAAGADKEMAAPEPIVAFEANMKQKRARGPMMADEFRHVSFVVVREFAHQVRPGRKPNDRLDFTETLYWSAALKTNEKGEAEVRFAMSDAVTSFSAQAGGYTADGAIGSAEVKIDSVQPFYLEPKLPLEVTVGDVVRLPLSVVNGTKERLADVKLALTTKGDVRFTAPEAFSMAGDERVRRVVDLTIGTGTSTADLTVNGTAGAYQDVVTRQLNVKPRGFPAEQAFGGLLEKNGKVTLTVEVPPDAVRGSFQSNLAIYPSPLGNLTEALARLVREPGGCFEQTSSTTYPMTMAMQYFQSHSGAPPELVRSAQEKLERGYQRLVGFECKTKGYEWFGQDPGHEALSAYGLLQFNDMAKVRQVDQGMVGNTRDWLMKQRDGKGGFERKRRALHTWVEDRDVSDAYITWALLESGTTGLTAEIAHLKEIGRSSKNSYVTAIVANVMALAGDKAEAKALMGRLAEKQNAQGLIDGATGSIVGSMGPDLVIEATSFAALAWLREPAFLANVEKSMKGLAESCKDGRYGSTQSTVLALRAIVAYDKKKAGSRVPGTVRVMVDGRSVGNPGKFDGSTEGAVKLADVAELLAPGKHVVELVQEGGMSLPYSAAFRWHREKPESAPDAMVALDVKLTQPKLNEGDVVEAVARVSNVTDQQLPTVVAIVGVPGGLEPRHDQLKELVKQQTIDAYEVMGRDVVLYWRGMTPKQSLRVPVSLVAAVPGTYTGPASRAYLYYADGKKAWVSGLGADIVAKK